jgi:hypothetical protein
MKQKLARRSRSVPKAAAARSQGRWQDIPKILAKVDPPAAKRRQCWPIVIAAVRMVHAVDRDLPPGKLKRQYEATATALEKTRAALMGLPDNRRHSLLILPPPPERSESFARSRRLGIDDLNWLIERCRDQADKIAIKRGGGRPDERHDARRKQMAFRCAFELLYRYNPTRAKGERVYELADLLFEAATGRTADCKTACVGFLRVLRRQKNLITA